MARTKDAINWKSVPELTWFADQLINAPKSLQELIKICTEHYKRAINYKQVKRQLDNLTEIACLNPSVDGKWVITGSDIESVHELISLGCDGRKTRTKRVAKPKDTIITMKNDYTDIISRLKMSLFMLQEILRLSKFQGRNVQASRSEFFDAVSPKYLELTGKKFTMNSFEAITSQVEKVYGSPVFTAYIDKIRLVDGIDKDLLKETIEYQLTKLESPDPEFTFTTDHAERRKLAITLARIIHNNPGITRASLELKYYKTFGNDYQTNNIAEALSLLKEVPEPTFQESNGHYKVSSIKTLIQIIDPTEEMIDLVLILNSSSVSKIFESSNLVRKIQLSENKWCVTLQVKNDKDLRTGLRKLYFNHEAEVAYPKSLHDETSKWISDLIIREFSR